MSVECRRNNYHQIESCKYDLMNITMYMCWEAVIFKEISILAKANDIG